MGRLFSRRHSIAAGIAAAILAGCAATPSWAQLSTPGAAVLGPGSGPNANSGNPDRLDPVRYNLNIRTVTPSRVLTEERMEFNALDLERRRARMDDDEIRADIAVQLERAGVACEVGAFKRVGMTPEAQSIYETACGAGPGYVLVNGVEPEATSCIVLAGAAASARRRDPNARTGAQCTLPENQNGAQLIGAWAREAGVTCKVDQAEWLESSDDGDLYEIGCEGSEGFWLEKAATGWSVTGCLQVSAEGSSCYFTDPNEQRAWMRAQLTGTPAQGCDIAEVRMIGTSSLGHHYETRCSTPGQGFLVRIPREGTAEEVTPCAEAVGRTPSCTLTRSDG